MHVRIFSKYRDITLYFNWQVGEGARPGTELAPHGAGPWDDLNFVGTGASKHLRGGGGGLKSRFIIKPKKEEE